MRLGARRNARMEPSATGKKWQFTPGAESEDWFLSPADTAIAAGLSYPLAHMRARPSRQIPVLPQPGYPRGADQDTRPTIETALRCGEMKDHGGHNA